MGFRSGRYSLALAWIATRPARKDNGGRIRNAAKLEIARLGAAIYPHKCLVLSAADSRAFAFAMHERVPQAEFEPA